MSITMAVEELSGQGLAPTAEAKALMQSGEIWDGTRSFLFFTIDLAAQEAATMSDGVESARSSLPALSQTPVVEYVVWASESDWPPRPFDRGCDIGGTCLVTYDAIVRMRGVLEFTSAAGSPRSGGCLNSWLVSSCPIYAVLLLLLLLLFFSQSRHWTSISRGSRSTLSSR